MKILVPISPGDLYDRITILEIKSERIKDPEKLKYVNEELRLLREIAAEYPIAQEVHDGLKAVNEKLWDIEDGVRDCEARKDFGPAFVEFARSVYMTNEKRLEYKTKISMDAGSEIVEMKQYKEYK